MTWPNPAIGLAAVLLSLPATGLAETYCIDASGSQIPPGSCPDGVFTTAADALAAISADQPAVVNLAFRGGVHSETVVIDQDALGVDDLTVGFVNVALCPSPGSPATEPLITVVSDGLTIIDQIEVDLSSTGPCPSQHTGIRLEGGGEFYVISASVVGTTGAAIDVDRSGAALNGILVDRSQLHDGDGAAVRLDGFGSIRSTGISGFVHEGSAAYPGIVSVGDGTASIQDSVIFGNLFEGSGDPSDGLVSGSIDAIENTVFAANGTVDAPLVALVAEERIFFPGPPEVREPGITDSSFTRNRRLDSVDTDVFVRPGHVLMPSPEAGACPGGVAGPPLSGVDSPVAGFPAGSGPLISIGASLTSPGARIRDALVFSSLFADNELGDAALILLDGDLAPHQLQLMHNTVETPRAVVEVLGAEGGSSVLLARNLLVSGALPAVVLGADELRVAIATMNAGPPDAVWFDAVDSVPFPLVGPNPPWEDLAFLPLGDVEDLEPCALSMSACPDRTLSTCDDERNGGRMHTCPGDQGLAFIPTGDSAAQLARDWPWVTDLFSPEQDGSSVPGITGWTCEQRFGAYDRTEANGDVEGDGDGWPNLIDCNNADSLILPSLPDPYGFESGDCVQLADDCYLCPGQSEDTGAPGDDDDDSATIDDDDATDLGEGVVPVGCTSRGCGAAIDCGSGSTLAWLMILPLGMRRRRRSSPRPT